MRRIGKIGGALAVVVAVFLLGSAWGKQGAEVQRLRALESTSSKRGQNPPPTLYRYRFQAFGDNANVWRFDLKTGDACLVVSNRANYKSADADGLICDPTAGAIARLAEKKWTPVQGLPPGLPSVLPAQKGKKQ